MTGAAGDVMPELVIKNCHIGDGNPKICVPLVGRTEEEILKQAIDIVKESARCESQHPGYKVDIVEFRADYYDDVTNSTKLLELLKVLRDVFSDKLLLFTYRSEEEGGEFRHDRAENMLADIYEWVIVSGLVDLIDIELLQGNYYVVRNSTKAHDNGVRVIISNHDLEKTPHDADMEEMLREMKIFGADIMKIATTPKNEFDVRRLMEFTENVTKGNKGYEDIQLPLVTMAMGELGKKTRVSGKTTGSAITFAMVGNASAPGQLPLEELMKELENN